VLSLSSLIEFLLDMLRDESTQQDFARDPSATLAARGLSGVTAQDVRDVQPMLADVGGVHRVVHEAAHHSRAEPVHAFSGTHSGGHGGGHDGGHDVVREIHHVTHEYAVARPVTQVTQEYKTYNSFTEFSTDNSVHASEGSTVIQGSYNQDNDGVDNKGGTIDGSTVGGHDVGQSGNQIDTTTVTGSGNDNHAVTETGSENVEVTHGAGTEADADADPYADQGHHGADDAGDHDGPHAAITYGDSYGGSGGYSGDVNDSYSAQSAPTAVAPSDGAEHAAAGHL
jgi:hypothetical protein